jgi:hypothetical protein
VSPRPTRSARARLTLAQRAPQWAHGLVERGAVRLTIGAAIVLSLLPVQWPAATSWAFLALFGAELALRALALSAPRQADEPADLPRWLVLARRGGFLALDTAALASFLPGVFGIPDARWLRLFRLARLVLLIRYWSTLISDLRAVLLRRERARKVALMGGAVALVSFCGTVLLDHLTADRVDFDGDGVPTVTDTRFAVRLWWAFRQVQDPGNMLSNPSDLAVVAVSLGLTVFGLFLVSFLIGLGTDVVREVIDIAANRPAGLTGHTVVVGVNGATRPLLEGLMGHYHKSAMSPHFAVVGASETRPHFLDEPALSRVVYRHGHDGEERYLDRVDIAAAKRVLLLADPQRPSPDAATLGLILSVRASSDLPREAAPRLLVVAEILDPANLGAARAAGGDHTVIVPSEQLIGLFVGAVAREPMLTRVLEALLTSTGHEAYSYLFGSQDLGGLPLPARWPSFDALTALAASHGREVCIPIAWLTAPARDPSAALVAPTLHLAPGPGAAPPDTVGFFAIAPSFRATRSLAAQLNAAGPPSPAAAPSGDGANVTLDAPARPLSRVLVCGSREGTFDLCEALMLAQPSAAVTLLVDDADALAAFRDGLAERQLLAARGDAGAPRGAFREAADGTLTFAPSAGGPASGTLYVHAADWTSERVLTALPGFGDHVRTMDAVLYLAGPAERSDGRTAMSVLKLAELQVQDGGFSPEFRVVAAVTDTSLRHHLALRYQKRVGPRALIAVFSSQELRAWFTFQAAAVPGFHPLYDALLRPGGTDLVRRRLDPARVGVGTIRFVDLARRLRTPRRILIAVETIDHDGGEPALHIAPGPQSPGYDLDVACVDSVWLIEREDGEASTEEG